MPIIRLIEGPVGAGNSTFAADLAARTGGVHIALDAWSERVFELASNMWEPSDEHERDEYSIEYPAIPPR
jgi:adenylate kinase family enzyme